MVSAAARGLNAYAILVGMKAGFPMRLKRTAGFTIVETMIVMAVTGALFVAIAVTMSGRQNSAEFTHAIQDIQAKIQQTIDQVGQGFYSNEGFSCTASGGSVTFSAVPPGTDTQGTNSGCVFLGKVIQFHLSGTDPEQYQIYTIAGLRCTDAMAACQSPAGSPFQNVAPTVVGVGGIYSKYSTINALEYGLTTVWMKNNTSPVSDVGSVGFLIEPGVAENGSGNGYSNGIQQIDLVPIPGTKINTTGQIPIINSELKDPALTVNPPGGVQICFASGGTNQSGLITIGGSGRQLDVTLDIKSNRTCS